VICAKAEQASGRLPPVDLERFLALQRWLALGDERRVILPFGWALGRAMSTCSLELRTRRDFDGLLACVKTIAFLHQRHRKQAPGGEIEAIIDDYRVARELLIGSFRAAEAESLPAAIRELVSKIGEKEEITRPRLGERVNRPRSTLYHQVDRAINEFDLLHEETRGGKRILTRNPDVPLPEALPPLPDVEEVEGWFFGVPAPDRRPGPYGVQCFDNFIEDFRHGGSEGFTAAEWAARVGQPVEVVHKRLDLLFQGGTLAYDAKTERYAVRIVESPIDPPPAQGEAANPTPASNLSSGAKSGAEQAKSSDVQPSNESGGGTGGGDVPPGP